MLSLIRLIIKSLVFFVLLILFLLLGFINQIIFMNSKSRISNSLRITSFFLKICLPILGVRVRSSLDKELLSRNESFLIISNHLSYLDMFSISSVLPAVFVAGVDGVQDTFLVGTVTRLSGGLFVERQSRSRINEDLNKISKVLNEGVNVVLFPEGTTSNGDSVMPFKSSFFASAIESKTDLLPICIKYRKINGNSVDESNRDLIYFYGGIGFFEHFFRMLKLSSIEVDLNFLQRIEVKDSMNRKELAEIAHNKILSYFKN